MAGEGFLQGFYSARVFARGDDEDWRARRSFEVVRRSVARLIEWLYQSSTGLYPGDARPAGSREQDLHVQSDTSASDFDFLLPLRFNPELRLRGRGTVRDPSAADRRLPTHIYGAAGVSVFRCGSRVLLDLDTLRAEGATAYCDEPAPLPGSRSAGGRDRIAESIDNHHLDPVRILQDFHRYVQNALTADENSHPRDDDPVFQARMIKPRVPQIHKSIKERMTLQPWDPKCPAVQLIFRLGEEELISVDLVPAIQDKVMLSEDWQRSDLARLSDWWDVEPGNSQERFRQKGEELGRVRADVVAKDGFWRFSFANAETAFLRDIDSDGGQRRKALRLLKFINKECWVPEYGKILTSYHLKTVLLWAQDIHPETEKWETLESSLKTLLSVLRHCVNTGKLPHYFLRDFNLFNKRYREGNGFFERLALQVLDKEGELLAVDPVQYISRRVPKKDSEHPGAFSGAEASLQGFKASHLQKLKELEEKRLYEWEEEEPDNKNIQAPRDGPMQAEEQFAIVDVTSENDPGFQNDVSERVYLVQSLAWRREDLTLDPDTAHPLLEISADGKEVRCGTSTGNISSSPRRFDMAICVVTKQSFSGGRHYWEVFVGRKRRWNLGVVSERAERRGRLIQRKSWWWPWSEEICTEGYWLIGYNQEKPEKPYWAFDTNPMPFDCNPRPQTIGVYLDYTGREVTFYNADDPKNLIPLFTLYHADFKNAPVYPVFDPCWHDNGSNTQPLKIL